MNIFTRAFILAATERAAKTAAQVVVATYFASQVGSVIDIGWAGIGSLAAYGFVASLLTSIASAPVSADGPSLVGERLDKAA